MTSLVTIARVGLAGAILAGSAAAAVAASWNSDWHRYYSPYASSFYNLQPGPYYYPQRQPAAPAAQATSTTTASSTQRAALPPHPGGSQWPSE